MWAHYNNAHQPYVAPCVDPNLFVDDEFYDGSRKIKVNEPEYMDLSVPENHPCYIQICRPDMGGVHPDSALQEKPEEFAFYIARYDTGIYSADSTAGDLLKAVREMGLLDNTIVVLVGDHGESLGDHDYFFRHGRFPYDACVKVPMMIRPVGGTEGKRIDVNVPVLGLAATILDMVDFDPPDEMEAGSLLPMIQGKEKIDFIFAESGYQLDYTISVREGKWKLIHVPNKVDRSLMTGSEYELYNLETDPGELQNLYNKEPEISTRLVKVLKEWSDPWIEEAYVTFGIGESDMDKETLEHLRKYGVS